jgi:hypothetical protein
LRVGRLPRFPFQIRPSTIGQSCFQTGLPFRFGVSRLRSSFELRASSALGVFTVTIAIVAIKGPDSDFSRPLATGGLV